MVNNEELMFSVEMTTYNQEKYVGLALQSIIDQKHNYKYEILVSDDCSTDGTQNVIREFQKQYPDIIKPVYNEKNLGAMKNYYKNIVRTKGKYIMGCAGDDYWLPEKVQEQINFMENNKSFDVCYSKANYLINGNLTKDTLGNYFREKKEVFEINNIPALTLCIRADFYKKYLKEIEPQNKDWLMEDYPFNIYALYNSNVFFINKELAVYRILDGSTSHQINLRKQFLFEQNTYYIKKYFSEKFNETIRDFDEIKVLKKIVHELSSKQIDKRQLKKENNLICKEFKIRKMSLRKIVKIIKKIIKYVLPYGLCVLLKKI